MRGQSLSPAPWRRARSISYLCLSIGLLAGNVCSAARAIAAQLSYEDARAELHAVSDLQKSGEASVSKSVYTARSAESLGWPDLFVNATEVWGIKTGSIPGTPLGTIDFGVNFQGPRASINSTWSIYSGGRITATQRALAAGADEARAELDVTVEKLDVQLAQVYFGVELAANVERTRGSILSQADRHLQRAVRFEQQGLVAKVDRLNAQVARDQAARDYVGAQSDRDIAQARLQRVLRRNAPIEPSTSLFVITGELKPLTEWLATAERNPILKAFDAKREQARQGIVIAESRWKPEVFAFGSYGLIRHYQTLIEPNWIAGIGVNFTLFAHEDRASKVSAAREALRQVETLDAETRNEIDSAVETAYRKVLQARDQFKLLDSTIASAQENLRLRESGFDEGQATSLDVNDARNALAAAETSRAKAAYDFVVALAQLLEASGQANTLSRYVAEADVRLRP